MSKLTFTILLITITISGLVFSSNMDFGNAQTPTPVNGIITQNTTWTKANSPYNLIGNVFVNNGVKLTIEAGVIVNFNGYYLMVSGTLIARGTETDKIQLNLGYIIFREDSAAWNEQTASGSVIESTNLDAIKVQSASPKINKNSMYAYNVSSEAIDIEGGSPIITNNNITGPIIINGSPTISNNNITADSAALFNVGGSPLIENNNIIGTAGTVPDVNKYPWSIVAGVIMIDNGSPFLVNNTIDEKFHSSSMSIGCCGGSGVTLRNNTIYGEVYSEQIPFTIEGNVINGTLLMGSNGYNPDHPVDTQITVISNTIDSVEIDVGKATIQHNLILGDITLGTVVAVNAGPETTFTAVTALIQNNIINGTIYYQSSASSAVNYNNLLIQNNQKTIRLSTGADVDATNNWWGTTDQTTIRNAIYDFNNDFNLGKVNFIPFLTAPNSQATPSTPEFPSIIIVTIALMVIAFALVVIKKKRKICK